MVVLLYMPLCVIAFTVYGDSLRDSVSWFHSREIMRKFNRDSLHMVCVQVVYSVQTEWLQLFANGMIAVHCILTLVCE